VGHQLIVSFKTNLTISPKTDGYQFLKINVFNYLMQWDITHVMLSREYLWQQEGVYGI